MPYKDPERQKAYDQERGPRRYAENKQRAIETGLCFVPGCGKPHSPGILKCEEHARKDADAMNALADRRLKDRICIQCHKNPAEPHRSKCANCRAVSKRFYDKRKEQGMCIYAGCHNPALPDRVMCESCVNDAKNRRKLRIATGLCVYGCNSPAVDGTQRCKRCGIKLIWSASAANCKRKGYAPINMSLDSFVIWYENAELQANGLCDYCKQPFTDRGPVVDHDHETGEVRGFVCHPCNHIEGYGRARVEAVLKKMIEWESKPRAEIGERVVSDPTVSELGNQSTRRGRKDFVKRAKEPGERKCQDNLHPDK